MTGTLLFIGSVLVLVGLLEAPLRRWPISPALVYLLLGAAAGALFGSPLALGARGAGTPASSHALLIAVEAAVLVSLFGVGLRLPFSPRLPAWRVAAWLASVGMVATVALGTFAAMLLLGLAWPAAMLLAAMLAPTDPVLASDVQLRSAEDRDSVRFTLTAEGGLNDGSALPVVMLALAALGHYDLGPLASGWLWRDLIWGVGGGVAIGAALGRALGWALRWRIRHGHALGWDELLMLGSIALAFGAGRASGTSSFIVVFIMAVVLFHAAGNRRLAPEAVPSASAESSELAARLEAFGGRCERLIEVALVLVVGAALTTIRWTMPLLLFALALVLIVRPLAALATMACAGPGIGPTQRRLIAWFGIRGVGSLYYLLFAREQGLGDTLAATLSAACLVSIAVSIVLHGVSATPLMAWYQTRRETRRAGRPTAAAGNSPPDR